MAPNYYLPLLTLNCLDGGSQHRCIICLKHDSAVMSRNDLLTNNWLRTVGASQMGCLVSSRNNLKCSLCFGGEADGVTYKFHIHAGFRA